MTTIAAAGSPSRGRSAICRMYTDVQASGSIQVVLSSISTAGTRCCCASASAEITAASASITVGVNPDRRTRQVNRADHKHSAVSSTPSHQPEICFVAASTATAVNKTAPPRRRAIAYQPASQCRAWSDGPANRRRRSSFPRRPAGGWICLQTKSAAGPTGPVCGRTRHAAAWNDKAVPPGSAKAKAPEAPRAPTFMPSLLPRRQECRRGNSQVHGQRRVVGQPVLAWLVQVVAGGDLAGQGSGAEGVVVPVAVAAAADPAVLGVARVQVAERVGQAVDVD